MTPSRSLVRRFLDAHSTLTLACADADGPWAADVYYVRLEGRLYFFSSPESRHMKALTADPRTAGTIHGTYDGWAQIRGIQLEGRVEPVGDLRERGLATAAYIAKFAFSKDLLDAGRGALRQKVSFYRVSPTRVLFIDNAMGLGHREDTEI